MDFAKETGKCLEEAEKWERVTGSDHSRFLFEALPPECLENLARSLSLMFWDMNFSEDWLCSLTVMAPKVVGADR